MRFAYRALWRKSCRPRAAEFRVRWRYDEGGDVSQLIDTTEMYLKTVYELKEENIPALRARIVERLGQSGPTVSETVSRLERDGLVKVGRSREIEFTKEGCHHANQVMRRHRLVERLLFDVIKLDWPRLHDEACRWEHVVSDDVADRIEDLLNNPHTDPYGNVIPAANSDGVLDLAKAGVVSVMDVPAGDGTVYVIDRIVESAQLDVDNLAMLAYEGFLPGTNVTVDVVDSDSAIISRDADSVRLSADVAGGIFLRKIQ